MAKLLLQIMLQFLGSLKQIVCRNFLNNLTRLLGNCTALLLQLLLQFVRPLHQVFISDLVQQPKSTLGSCTTLLLQLLLQFLRPLHQVLINHFLQNLQPALYGSMTRFCYCFFQRLALPGPKRRSLLIYVVVDAH